MAEFPKKLVDIAERLEQGEAPEKTTVRALLEWFGAQRRGYYVVQHIRSSLAKLDIRTEPDFEGAFIDALIGFVPADTPAKSNGTQQSVAASGSLLVNDSIADPTYRIGKLASANRPPLGVKPDATLGETVTLMLSHDYSQLPVMQSEREVKGAVTWRSIGSRIALGRPLKYARECMESCPEISAEVSLFAAIDTIVKHEYVLIRGADRKVCGIVTTSDLSLQFLQLGEPFLLIGEIENHMRRLIQGRAQPSVIHRRRPR